MVILRIRKLAFVVPLALFAASFHHPSRADVRVYRVLAGVKLDCRRFNPVLKVPAHARMQIVEIRLHHWGLSKPHTNCKDPHPGRVKLEVRRREGKGLLRATIFRQGNKTRIRANRAIKDFTLGPGNYVAEVFGAGGSQVEVRYRIAHGASGVGFIASNCRPKRLIALGADGVIDIRPTYRCGNRKTVRFSPNKLTWQQIVDRIRSGNCLVKDLGTKKPAGRRC